MSRADDVNATAAALLGLLRDGPASGYELARRAQDELGDFWTVTRSQVYRELAAMAQRGLVEAHEAGPRERRAHELTAAGRRTFSAWLHAAPTPDVVRIPLLLRLAFADGLEPTRLAELAAELRDEHAQRLAGYLEVERTALAAGATPRDLVTLRFGLRYEQAVLAWFDQDLSPLTT